ncbi:MAG: Asp-tRNA(Asn)/Glu-tRNA(Gln) amidotransferase subunit GatA [Nitrospinae bacterium]|nr:Asp-tRNA(Asn)/Glu-tRNA(Gln) amidotransferase subunit GatA [Nitrospinota bacterium]
MSGLCALTIHELADKLDKGEVTSEQATRAYLNRIASLDKSINSYITVDAGGAMTQAREADSRRAKGERGPLLGVPLGIKDVLLAKGLRSTCGSKMLENFIAPYDAFVTGKLRAAGAVTLGKTNMDEFAMGSSTENSHFGSTKNPWDLTRIPGGSSGGSAAAVAADLCAGSLGSDTGGSIRQPASLCGVVGLKPTYGRVSRFGLVAFASSLDQVGPMTKDTRDAAILLNAIAGYDAADSTSANQPVPDYTQGLEDGVKGLRVGLPKEYFGAGMDDDTAAALRATVDMLKDAGALVSEVSLPNTRYAVPTYYVLAPAEASSNLARYDGVKYGFRSPDGGGLLEMYQRTRHDGFGAEVKRRIMLGTYVLSSGYYDAYYLKAQKVRTLIRGDFLAAFKQVDVLLSPTSPTPAFPLGEKVDDPLTMYLCDIMTLNVNLAGIPGISVPCGHSAGGLPIGAQFMGPFFSEGMLLRAARVIERASGAMARKPSL